jgi:hypothetical protein
MSCDGTVQQPRSNSHAACESFLYILKAALAVIATARVTTERHRHRDRKIKTRQSFPHAPRGITTGTAPAPLHVCGTTAA